MWNVLRCNCQCNCIAFVQWKWMRVNSPLLGTFQTFRFCSALDLHPLAFLSPSSPNSFCYTSPSQDSKDCRSAAKRALQASNQEVSPGPGVVPAPKNWFRPLHPFSCRDSSIFNLEVSHSLIEITLPSISNNPWLFSLLGPGVSRFINIVLKLTGDWAQI